MKEVVMILACVLSVSSTAWGWLPHRKQACVLQKCVDVEVVSSKDEMMRGLSGRKGLKANQGMLFIFDDEGQNGFWMKDMNFNLDIIWMDQNRRIVDIKSDVPPCTKDACPIYASNAPAKYALEVNAGHCQRQGLLSGQQFEFRNISK